MRASPDERSDADLTRLALSGEDSAYRALTERYREPVYRLVRGMIGDADEALDVTQEAFLAAFGALSRYDPQRAFRTWIGRIAVNKCRDWARRRAVRRFLRFGLTSDDTANLVGADPPVDRIIEGREELDRVVAMLAALPQTLKEPLVLRSIDGMSQSETATLLGISEKAVETRVHRARTLLAARLRDVE